jgi:hypothetical protein
VLEERPEGLRDLRSGLFGLEVRGQKTNPVAFASSVAVLKRSEPLTVSAVLLAESKREIYFILTPEL